MAQLFSNNCIIYHMINNINFLQVYVLVLFVCLKYLQIVCVEINLWKSKILRSLHNISLRFFKIEYVYVYIYCVSVYVCVFICARHVIETICNKIKHLEKVIHGREKNQYYSI